MVTNSAGLADERWHAAFKNTSETLTDFDLHPLSPPWAIGVVAAGRPGAWRAGALPRAAVADMSAQCSDETCLVCEGMCVCVRACECGCVFLQTR